MVSVGDRYQYIHEMGVLSYVAPRMRILDIRQSHFPPSGQIEGLGQFDHEIGYRVVEKDRHGTVAGKREVKTFSLSM